MNATNEKPAHPLAILRADIKAALPTFGLKDEREQMRMSSVLMVAVERDPELVFADRQSLIAATRQCANHGLVPDGNEATLQVYSTKIKLPDGQEKWIKKVQYQPMVRGIIKRVLQSGKVLSFWADLVYKGEAFAIDTSQGDRRPIHSPDHFNRGGEIVGAYAVAKMANGSIDCEPMNMTEIGKVRSVAKTQKVWDKWFEEKAKVAVMRRLSKRLPLSSEDMDFIMNYQEHSMEPRDVTPARKEGPNLAQMIASGPSEPNTHTPAAQKSAGEADIIDGTAKTPAEVRTTISDAEIERDGFPGSQAFDHGVSAFEDGKPEADCPYDLSEARQEALDWHLGYRQAARARQ